MFRTEFAKSVLFGTVLSAGLLLSACGGGGGGSNGGSSNNTSSQSSRPPSGRVFYVYATNDVPGTQDSISMFSADSNIGDLTSLGTINAGANPNSITVVNNRFVYVANSGTVVPPPGVGDPGGVSAYSINANTGALSPIGTYAAGANPTSVRANNGYLYATNFEGTSVSVYHIESNGSLTGVGEYSTNFGGVANGVAPAQIAFSGDGRYAYTANKSHTNATVNGVGNGTVTVFSVAGNGALTAIQNVPAGIDPISVTVVGQSLYVANNQLPDDPSTPQVENTQGNVTMFPINGDGTLGALNAYVAGYLPQAVVGDSNNVYVATSGAANVTKFARAASGALSGATGMQARNTPWGLTIDPSGQFLYVANNAVGSDGGISVFYLPGGATQAQSFASSPSTSAVAATAVMP